MGDHSGSRRKAPRVETSLAGTLRGRSQRQVTVLDLSSGGCLVRGDTRLEPGAIFDLALRLGEEELVAKVRVAESSRDGSAPPGAEPLFLAGLRFLALQAEEAARLARFLAARRRP
jgi:hypothetical protein